MRQPARIAEEIEQISTITNLSGIFETIASMQISKIKKQVLASKDFFNELWTLYTELDVDTTQQRFNRQATKDKDLFLVITAEGGFSGDIDQKLIQWMLKSYDPNTTDIIVIGHHGAVQLAQHNISIEQYFKMPEEDKEINVEPIMRKIVEYPRTTAFYQTYVSLSIQDVKRITLLDAVKGLSRNVEQQDIISTTNYIFEPSDDVVKMYLESSMLGVALAQVIYESKLAQYASRFRAMTAAHDRAEDMQSDLKLDYNRAKRSQADARLKEIIVGMQLVGGNS